MTISFTGTGQDNEDQYSVSGSISEWEGGKSISLSLNKLPKPQPAAEPPAAQTPTTEVQP